MRLRSIAIVVVAAAGLSACGGEAPVHAPGTPQNPSTSRLTAPTGPAGTGRSNEAAMASSGSSRAQAGSVDATDRVGARSQRPCGMVSRAQATAIVGGKLTKPVTAPNGPTCIYRTARDGRMFSVAVSSQTFDQGFKRQVGRTQKLKVSGRSAYCATTTQPTLYVPLAEQRTLVVAAPCAVAQKFAATALRSLAG